MRDEDEQVPAELRQRVEAFLDEHNAVARELVRHTYVEATTRERRALAAHVDALIAARTEAYDGLDARAVADIEATYAGMPGSAVANAQAGGAAEVLFTLRQRLTPAAEERRDG